MWPAPVPLELAHSVRTPGELIPSQWQDSAIFLSNTTGTKATFWLSFTDHLPQSLDPRVTQKPSFPGCVPTKWQIAQLDGFQTWDYAAVWRNMVKEYSSRQLTFASDKLPALMGLADSFRRKVNVGTYLTGLWSHSIERDIAWRSYGDNSPSGRPRKEPSWTWVSAGDGRVEWPPLLFHDWYRAEPVMCTEHQPEPHAHCLAISGLLLPVSLQTRAERDDFETTFPLNRQVNVIPYTRRHSEPQLQVIHRASRLVPTLPGRPDSQDDKRTQTLEYKTPILHYGSFNADYKFWEKEEELQEELQHAVFFFIGTEPDMGGGIGWDVTVEYTWADGILLRPVDREGPSIDHLCRYERLGWLRYCTLKTQKEWRPIGVRSKFLMV
jgi:hypothetical protein